MLFKMLFFSLDQDVIPLVVVIETKAMAGTEGHQFPL